MFKEERNEYFWHTLFCSDDLLPPNKQARATMQSCHGYNSNWSYLASAFLCRDVTKKFLRQEQKYRTWSKLVRFRPDVSTKPTRLNQFSSWVLDWGLKNKRKGSDRFGLTSKLVQY